jgi:hypothetical protein
VLGSAACGGATGALHVEVPSPDGAHAAQCAGLVSSAPATVDELSRRTFEPRSPYAAAWGDPAIVLRCGGAKPAALRPTSQCFVINGVGWFVSQNGKAVDPTQPVHGALDFTTIGRSVSVEVTIPSDYQPAADAIVDLTPTVKSHTTVEHPCR